MEIHVDTGEPQVFRLAGRFTYQDNDGFTPVIEAAKSGSGRTVVIDLERLDFVDSFGIGLFLLASEAAKGQHNTLVVRNARGAVGRIFQLANLDVALSVEAAPRHSVSESLPRVGVRVSPLRREADGGCAVALSGRLTFADHETYEAALKEWVCAGCKLLRIDVSELDFMDSAGLSLLLLAREELERNGCAVELLSPRGKVAQLFNLAAIASVVKIRDDA
ncbi:STAS domain-containing protein [Magnetospirillum sp. UT-4]|uniref:STAS domain-containing protein n=1 Tax=Magnetospirillum sp. UT-4 TaxID=2681467 RepID=UPI0013808703|nr:STAS domain-containing protein [Magnetospirillum sp. UT-4]CAA7615211.1 conserved hypothetical protein [Magnetospirillum sp. UT-4]